MWFLCSLPPFKVKFWVLSRIVDYVSLWFLAQLVWLYILHHWGIFTLKPAIRYLRTWRIGDEIIFSPNKILLVKTRWMCCCTLFHICHQFLRGRRFFFWRKNTLCSSTRLLPRCKSCIQRMAKNLFVKHGERLLYTIRHTLFFHHFAPILLLFANRYSGLKNDLCKKSVWLSVSSLGVSTVYPTM